jgi:hypothetical protein
MDYFKIACFWIGLSRFYVPHIPLFLTGCKTPGMNKSSA